MDRRMFRKMACGLMAALLLFAIGTAVAAPGGAPPGDPKGFLEKVEAALDQLVSQGTITQEQRDRLDSFFREKSSNVNSGQKPDPNGTAKPDRGQAGGMLQELMAAGHLSLEQAKIVDEALKPPAPPQGGNMPPR